MPILSSKDWKATESTDFAGGNRKLVVTGNVEMSQGGELPVLSEAEPQGINPSILILELNSKVVSDVGTGALTWEPVAYDKAISHNQYSQVEIRGHATVDVEEILS